MRAEKDGDYNVGIARGECGLFPTELCLFSQTKSPNLYSFTVETSTDSGPMNYNISIMDTPGLFEKTLDKTERNNLLIKETISKCLHFEIRWLHCLFLFVLSNLVLFKKTLTPFWSSMTFLKEQTKPSIFL